MWQAARLVMSWLVSARMASASSQPALRSKDGVVTSPTRKRASMLRSRSLLMQSGSWSMMVSMHLLAARLSAMLEPKRPAPMITMRSMPKSIAQLLTAPALDTTHLAVVRPSSPTGPRAWNLPVEMPVSAPRPYS